VFIDVFALCVKSLRKRRNVVHSLPLRLLAEILLFYPSDNTNMGGKRLVSSLYSVFGIDGDFFGRNCPIIGETVNQVWRLD